jgi:predicted ATPase
VVADVCRRLEGIPLVLELAARARLLDVEQIGAWLDNHLRLLVGRTARRRRVCGRCGLQWSGAIQLLSDPEQHLFKRLAVFAGGVTLEAAEATACSGEAVDAGDVLDPLAQLVGKSLMLAGATGEGTVRYRMLGTLPQIRAQPPHREWSDEQAPRHSMIVPRCISIANG